MGESKDKEPAAAAAPAGGGGKTILLALVSSLVSVVAALAVFYFVFMPKLADAPEGEEGEEHEVEAEAEDGGHGGGGHGEEATTSLAVSFEESFATLIMPSPDMPASVLLYKVTIDCGNSNAKGLIEAHMPRFVAKIRELHSYRKREEVDNPQLEQDILKSIVQESNAILQELLGKPSEKTRVVAAYHEKFFIQDS
ncbi:MAG: hypothetical protein SGI88_17095 [Candidatus Hydrogenedentes bacterium]|nr:hypothetical protein [Candidatus Hydrogenedentota bacterium]